MSETLDSEPEVIVEVPGAGLIQGNGASGSQCLAQGWISLEKGKFCIPTPVGHWSDCPLLLTTAALIYGHLKTL